MNNKKIYDNLIEVLIKKANGFYFTEEQKDYEKAQNKDKNSKNNIQNLSFFDNSVMVEDKNKFNSDTIEKGKNNENEDTDELVLVKKKITTHYIPPDMLAVKILFETLREKVSKDDIENLTDEELLNLKDKLIGELLNETNKNQ